jgi:hypothetical protein
MHTEHNEHPADPAISTAYNNGAAHSQAHPAGSAFSQAAREVTTALSLTRRAQAVYSYGQWRLRWDCYPDESWMPGAVTARMHAQAPAMYALLVEALAEHDDISQRINGRGELCICATCDRTREILAAVEVAL